MSIAAGKVMEKMDDWLFSIPLVTLVMVGSFSDARNARKTAARLGCPGGLAHFTVEPVVGRCVGDAGKLVLRLRATERGHLEFGLETRR
jgi:hypothetical protein